MRFALYEGEIVDIDLCLSQLSDIKYTEEMCLKYVRGLKEIENFLRKSYGSLMGILFIFKLTRTHCFVIYYREGNIITFREYTTHLVSVRRKADVYKMSLLWMEYESEFEHLVEASFARESHEKEEYFQSVSDRVRKIIYRDTRYNIDYLYTAYVLDDKKIMNTYAVWLYELMVGIHKKRFSKEQTKEYVIFHFEAIKKTIPEVVSPEKCRKLQKLVEGAQQSIRDYVPAVEVKQESRYETEIEEYMEALFQKDTRKAVGLIRKYVERGMNLDDIYVEILSESMKRVGELWHTAEITVDTDHYCTSVTQMAMAQMYDFLFDGKRSHKKILSVCPGMELHEMGARIITDLFENHGWDSIFLGAAVPVDYIIEAVRENQPDLVTLSVSMPQHLMDCEKAVREIRKEFPDIKIAVGGKAFESTNGIWKKWPVDIYSKDARELLARADQLCG